MCMPPYCRQARQSCEDWLWNEWGDFLMGFWRDRSVRKFVKRFLMDFWKVCEGWLMDLVRDIWWFLERFLMAISQGISDSFLMAVWVLFSSKSWCFVRSKLRQENCDFVTKNREMQGRLPGTRGSHRREGALAGLKIAGRLAFSLFPKKQVSLGLPCLVFVWLVTVPFNYSSSLDHCSLKQSIITDLPGPWQIREWTTESNLSLEIGKKKEATWRKNEN